MGHLWTSAEAMSHKSQNGMWLRKFSITFLSLIIVSILVAWWMSALYCLFSFKDMENVEFKPIVNVANTNFEDFLLHFQVIEENRKQPFESNVRICLLKYFFEPRSYLHLYTTGLFRASAAQRHQPNACKGAPGSCKHSWMIPDRISQPRPDHNTGNFRPYSLR